MADSLSGKEGEDVQFVELHEESTSDVYDSDFSSSSPKDTFIISCRSIHITDLPQEVFEHILKYLTFTNIAKLRLVSQYFNDTCSGLLNSEFDRLRVVVQQRFVDIKAQMPRRESSRRKHPLARESDIIETLCMRLTLLNMAFGKHIERGYICFFAGEIIDEIYKILNDIQETPNLSRAYKVTDELFDLSTMAMEYFKEHIEPSLPDGTYLASDVFEYPSWSTVRVQQAIQDGTAATRSATKSYKSPSSSLQNLNKRLKIMSKKVNRNSRDIANMKRTVKVLSQKINSLGEVINQMEWQQKCCNTTAFSDPPHKMNHIRAQLNLYKHEIEILIAKLSVCTDQKTKFDLKSIGTRVSSNTSRLSFIGGHSVHIKPIVSPSFVPNQEPRGLEVNKNYMLMKQHSLMFRFKEPELRKRPSSTITSMAECPDQKRSCTGIEKNDTDDSK